MHVPVEQYNPTWPSQFAGIKQDLEAILHAANIPYKSIEHVGSTSIPGMAAKPHIDLDIVVSEEHVQPTITALERTGLYKSLGELGLPQRWAMHFIPHADNVMVPRRSTYVCVDGCQPLRNHLAVRDTCRANPELRDEYSRVKLELSQQDYEDVSEYCVAKNDILARILTVAGMGEEVEAIRKLNVLSRKDVGEAIKLVGS